MRLLKLFVSIFNNIINIDYKLCSLTLSDPHFFNESWLKIVKDKRLEDVDIILLIFWRIDLFILQVKKKQPVYNY
jgi:hypothetical protein